MAKLNGKTALITGSTDGVGCVVAKRLGEAGLRVLVHGRDRGRGERVAAEITDAGGSAEFLMADLSALADVRRLADAVKKRRRGSISSSTMPASAPAGRSGGTADQHRRLRIGFAVNYLAGFLLTHLLLPLVKRARRRGSSTSHRSDRRRSTSMT